MRRYAHSALVLLLSGPPAGALPTADEVKVSVRKAVGSDAFGRLRDGLVFEGKAEFLGLPGTFTMRLLPDGRYVRVINATGIHAVGFDGKTRWGRNFADPVLDLHFEEADRDRFLFGVLCHRWLAADGGFAAAVDERTARAYKLDVILSHPDAGVTARLAVDTTTWLPEVLTVPGVNRPRLFDFADYRTVAGVTVPFRVGQDRYEGGQWVAADRVGPAPAGGANPCARPTDRAPVSFSPAVPARVESRQGPAGMVLLRGLVDEKPLPWLVLDTGNGAQSLLTPRIADQLKLQVAGDAVSTGVGGTSRTRFRTAGRLTVGPASVEGPVFAEVSDELTKAMSARAGAEIAGFIGRDFLARVVVEVDPAAGTAAVYDSTAYRLPAGGAWEAVRFNGRAPCVKAAFDGRYEGWYMFDTAFGAPVAFSRPAVARWKMLDGLATTTQQVRGTGGLEEVRAGPGGELKVFGLTSRTHSTLYAVDPAGGHNDPYTLGTFGPSALAPGTIVLDYPNSRIGFVPKG